MEARALGKGLSALIPEKGSESTNQNVTNINVNLIKDNTVQPRLNYDDEKLDELKASIKEQGVLQPILVRQSGSAYEVVAGELEALKGNIDKAIIHLKKAVVFEDALVYTEPAAWHIPTRQNLGSVLLKAKQYEAAEKIFKEDLEVLRQNGWSLLGLQKSLEAQGKQAEAKLIQQEFDVAWEHADIEIDDSVL